MKNLKLRNHFLYTLLVAVFCFFTAYLLASFTNWELDCRKWNYLTRWGVVWGTTVVSFLYFLWGRK